MKTLTISWKRLVNDAGQTCERCDTTGDAIQRAFQKLKKAVSALGIHVHLQTTTLDFLTFTKDPLQSNRILINAKPLEEWVNAMAGQSKCCDVCGDSECRTVSMDGNTYEAIPEELIIRAGLIAAAELFRNSQ